MVAAVTGFPARSRRRPHGGPAASRRYERRRPEKTPLHKIVSENLESWLEWREAAERPVPGYVEDELRGYLECGLLCFGFARAVCMTCRMGFVVAFSCKGRGVCPSCNSRHMAQTAAHFVDHVIPPVPVRQWVISVPKRLRGMLADRPRAVAALSVPTGAANHPGQSGRAYRAGALPRDPLVQALSPPRRRGRRRHARLGEQRVFSRRERPDHTHRPRCAQLFS